MIEPNPKAEGEEEEKMRRLRCIVDQAAHRVLHGRLTQRQVIGLIQETRMKVLELFPDKGPVFDLIHEPRLTRLFRDWG